MHWLSKRSTKIIMVLPALILFVGFVIIPIFISVYYSMKLFSNKVLLELCNIATKPVYHLMEYMYRYNMAFVSTFILPNYKNIGG